MPIKKRFILMKGNIVYAKGSDAINVLSSLVCRRDSLKYDKIAALAKSRMHWIKLLLEQLPGEYTLLVFTEQTRTRKNKSLYLKHINEGT